jgi:hypothetical protein
LELVVVRQGHALPSILFNLELEKLARDSGIETAGNICNKTIQVLAYYVDDFVLGGKTTGVLKEAIINFNKAAKEMGLKSI